MKSKQILILAAILAFLIVGIVIKKTHQRPELATEEYTPLDLSFDADKVVQVTIFKQKKDEKNLNPQVELVKEEGNWKMPGLWNAPVDAEKVENFLKEIKKAKGELRGNSKAVFEDFGISDQQGFHVSLYDDPGKELLKMVIGTKKSGYGSIFVRKKNSEAVYLTESNLYGQMGVYGSPESDEPQQDFWPVKKIAKFDSAQVTKIEMKKFENNALAGFHVLSKEKGKWKFLELELPFAPGSEKVDQYLLGLQNNAAEKVLDPKAKDYGFAKPRLQIKVTRESGDPVEIKVGDADTKDAAAYYLQSSQAPIVFLISKYYVENMAVDPDWFIGNNPLGIDSSKIEKLGVHADKIHMNFEPRVKKWDALTSYMEALKNFMILKAPAGKSKFGKYWIEIKKEGEAEPLIIDVMDTPVVNGEAKLYLAQKRGTQYLFSISPILFSQLFDNLARLEAPKT